MKLGFDSEKYLEEQSQAILERAGKFDDKLYLEFGGKLICDFHAARILPGFDPNAKIKLLQRLKDKVDIVICIYAGDIEQKKMRADFGLSYDTDTMRTIDDLQQNKQNAKLAVFRRLYLLLMASVVVSTLTLVLFSYLVKHAGNLPIWKYQWLYVFLLPSHAA